MATSPPALVVFCGHQGCSKPAVGEFVVTLWMTGDAEAAEKTMPVCGDCRPLAEQETLRLRDELDADYNMEVAWRE